MLVTFLYDGRRKVVNLDLYDYFCVDPCGNSEYKVAAFKGSDSVSFAPLFASVNYANRLCEELTAQMASGTPVFSIPAWIKEVGIHPAEEAPKFKDRNY